MSASGGLKTEIDQLFNALWGNQAVVYSVYPANAIGATVTTGKSYAYGAAATILADAGLTVDYWLTGAGLITASAIDQYQLQIGYDVAVPVYVAEFPAVDLTAATVNLPPFVLPYPVRVVKSANNGIVARAGAGSANNRTIDCQVQILKSFGN